MKRLSILVTVLALCGSASAQKPAIVASDKTGWHKIGETSVDFTREEDEVAVLAADRFAYLKFKVANAPVEIIDIDVIFEQGDKQNIRIGTAIKPEGSESRPIDLKGGAEREIKRIAFRYRTVEKGQNQKARIEIWGKKTNPDKETKDQKKDDVRDGAREAKSDVKEAGKEMKKESREVKKETKKEMKEAKKDMQN